MRVSHARAAVAALALLLSVGGVAVRAQAPTGATSPPPQTTEVKGDIPTDLVGRWLFMGQVTPTGPVPVPRLVEFRQGSGGLEVMWGPGELPKDLQEKSNAVGPGKAWIPTDADFKTLAREWDHIEPAITDQTKIENQLLVAAQYPVEFTKEPHLDGTTFAVVSRETFSGARRVSTTFSIFAVKDRTADRMTGPFMMISVAMGMFPIPIAVKGDFVAYRIEAASEPTFLERLTGMFRGCGRTK